MSSTEPHDDRTIYIDGEGGTYSRSTPHVFKKRPVDLACYCGMDINDPVHTEGIDLTPPTFIDPDEIEEYVPVQHYYTGLDGESCLMCHQPYSSDRHIHTLDQETLLAELKYRTFQFENEVPKSRTEQLIEENKALQELNEKTQRYLDSLPRVPVEKNPHSFFTTGDKVVLGGLGAFFVANLTVGIVNMVM